MVVLLMFNIDFKLQKNYCGLFKLHTMLGELFRSLKFIIVSL